MNHHHHHHAAVASTQTFKPTTTSTLFILLLLLTLLLRTTSSKKTALDYDDQTSYAAASTTYPDDPLQPIWDRVDKIPEALDVLLKARIDALLVQTQNEMEKMRTKISHMEGRLAAALAQTQRDITERITHKLISSEARVREAVSKAVDFANSSLSDIRSDILNISDALAAPLEDLAGDVTGFMAHYNESEAAAREEWRNATASSSNTCSVDTSWLQQMGETVEHLRETPTPLATDCSDHHWQRPRAPSGIYTTYPTMDPEAAVEVYCDMGEGGAAVAGAGARNGGWTVILRRHNTSWGLANFNRSWADYRAGFGSPGEGEWWYGLADLHALTYRQPYELEILMHDITLGYFNAFYATFRVESEGKKFGLVLEGFSGNVTTDSIHLEHRGRPFSTYDHDNDNWRGGNCAVENSGGWWYSSCVYSTLTAPLARAAAADEYEERMRKVARWVKMDTNQVLTLDDVTMRVRPANYGVRFDSMPRDGE